MRLIKLLLVLCLLTPSASINAAQEVDLVPLRAIRLTGHKTVTTAGTQVQLSSSSAVFGACTIKALSTNTGSIWVGLSSVSSSDGFELDASESISIDIQGIAHIYIDSDTNGEGVSYLCVK